MRRCLGVLLSTLLVATAIAAQPPAQALSIAQGLTAYSNGDFAVHAKALAGVRDVRRFENDLRVEATRWIDSAPFDQRDHRRLIAAAFALEAAAGTAQSGVRPAIRLLELGCGVLRQRATGAATEYEWQRAAVAWLLGLIPPEHMAPRAYYMDIRDDVRAHLRHAADRFPDDPRWRLARTIVDHELRTWPSVRPGVVLDKPVGSVVSARGAIVPAIRAFSDLLPIDALNAEARLRIGHLEFRRGRHDAALAHFAEAEARAGDRAVVYLARFFRGQLLQHRGDASAAILAYERALEMWPGAPSAATALASLLFQQDERDRAYALAHAALTDAPLQDPWRTYGQGDYREWPQRLERLRGLIK